MLFIAEKIAIASFTTKHNNGFTTSLGPQFDCSNCAYTDWLLSSRDAAVPADSHAIHGDEQLTKGLFTPNGVDFLAHLVDPNEEGAIELVPDKRISGPSLTARIVRTLTWLLSARDARRSFGSVLGYAREGRLDMDLPSCGLTGCVWGIEIDAGILAFQLNGVDLKFPIKAKEILVHTGNKQKRFAAYEPRVKSPWSRSSW